ncbi:hypothetical protein VP01_5307g1 [Puccinia sorghi]|uniref:Uncharacterized protein n=1 Tax=Puccinia sorghi TaxID=27349 RepID=A0A0L6UKA8_9BASI|nr:hypothetical protein VP01_5307g1 [Puccinia sorghi]
MVISRERCRKISAGPTHHQTSHARYPISVLWQRAKYVPVGTTLKVVLSQIPIQPEWMISARLPSTPLGAKVSQKFAHKNPAVQNVEVVDAAHASLKELLAGAEGPSPDQPPTPCPNTLPNRKLPARKPNKFILKSSPQPQPKFNFKRILSPFSAVVRAGCSRVGQGVQAAAGCVGSAWKRLGADQALSSPPILIQALSPNSKFSHLPSPKPSNITKVHFIMSDLKTIYPISNTQPPLLDQLNRLRINQLQTASCQLSIRPSPIPNGWTAWSLKNSVKHVRKAGG